jgi:hypothetical protein
VISADFRYARKSIDGDLPFSRSWRHGRLMSVDNLMVLAQTKPEVMRGSLSIVTSATC